MVRVLFYTILFRELAADTQFCFSVFGVNILYFEVQLL